MCGGTSTCSQELGGLSWPPPLQSHYARYDGFVVIHGTDTMAFAASVLSFVLENLQKTVILTGAQVPPRAPAGQRPRGSGPSQATGSLRGQVGPWLHARSCGSWWFRLASAQSAPGSCLLPACGPALSSPPPTLAPVGRSCYRQGR